MKLLLLYTNIVMYYDNIYIYIYYSKFILYVYCEIQYNLYIVLNMKVFMLLYIYIIYIYIIKINLCRTLFSDVLHHNII